MKNKILKTIDRIAAIAIVTYLLFTRKLKIPEEWIITTALSCIPVFLIRLWDIREKKKHIRRLEDLGGSLSEDITGEIRAPALLRSAFILGILLCWIAVPYFVILMYQDIGIPTDIRLILTLVLLFTLIISYTVMFIFIYCSLIREIQFDSHGVSYRKRFRRQTISWREFGNEKIFMHCITFYDRSGKKLFRTITDYPGAAEFLMMYERKKLL